MRYTAEVVVNLPRRSVLELLSERDNDRLWRPELALCEPIAGEQGCLGAETRLIYNHRVWGARELMERVTACELPDSVRLSLVSTNVVEHQVHRFTAENDSATRWSIESEVQLKRRKLQFLRRPSLPRDDAQLALESFKAFAEGPLGAVRLSDRTAKRATRPSIHLHHGV